MKILNLYAGVGGNRRLWGDKHEITAVEDCELIYDVEDHCQYVKIYLKNDISDLCGDLFAEEQKNIDFDPYD